MTVGLSQARRGSVRSAQPPETPHFELLQVPQFSLANAPTEWYSSDSRTSSPVSPRVSPSPKALKPATPDLHIRITPSSPQQPGYRERYGTPTSPTGPSRITLRSSRTKPTSGATITREHHHHHHHHHPQGAQVSNENIAARGQHLESSSIPHVCSTSVNQLTVPTRLGRNHRYLGLIFVEFILSQFIALCHEQSENSGHPRQPMDARPCSNFLFVF